MQPSNHQVSLVEIQQHEDFTSRGDSEKKSELQMGFEPTTLHELLAGNLITKPGKSS